MPAERAVQRLFISTLLIFASTTPYLVADFRLGSFSTDLVGLACRLMSASPRMLTEAGTRQAEGALR
jgi:hypothetical protein